ncbi:MAG: gliding motility-associated C-terminal domain-containing protein, partial [Algibacter sp.]|uniref:T9SS type B sorting domain-containing protein n=1 Tax=Algibacter sp. TaxID=1872428 RepID=UPI003298C911
ASIIDQTNVDCFGNSTGQVTVEANGGIPPYSYSIDNGSNYQNNGTFSNLSEGSYTVIAVDANGCTFKQIVEITTIPDVTNPTIECPENISLEVTADNCEIAATEFTLGTPLTNDDCLVSSVNNDAPDTFPLGETIVTWTVTDGSGNTATCEQTVTIIDNIDPTFVDCAAPVSVNVDANGCTTDIANINLGTPTVNDNCTETTITNDAPDTFPLGETIVTWTVTDGSGNTATCEQTVTIIDNIDPTFVESLPEDATYECDNIPMPDILTATDPCGTVDVSFTETIIDGACSGNYYIERKWVATDQNGLTTEHTQTITIEDTKAPQPTTNIPSSIIINCDSVPEIPNIEFLDSCSSIVNVEFNETNSLDENNPSDYQIVRTWTVSDDCNNEQIYTQTISVTLIDFVSTINESACSTDGIIDLNGYLSNTDAGGEWTVIEGNAVLDDNLFDPEKVELGTYKFTYSIPNGGCLNSVEVNLEIHDDCIVFPCGEDDVVISKVITPNGDAYNEFFKITGVENCGFVIELQIFNRWGAKIYDNSNYQNNWNGFAHNSSVGKAEKVPNGTYFYIINLKNSGLEPFAKAFYVGTK